MSKEQDLFTVAEDEKLEREIISIAEEYPAETNSEPEYRVHVSRPSQPTEGEKPKGYLETKDVSEFMNFLKEELSRIPNFEAARGNSSLMERSLGQWKGLNGHCSHALRGDYRSIIDVNEVNKARQYIETTIDSLEDALYSMEKLRKTHRQRRRGEEDFDGLTKEANVAHFRGFQMMITPFQKAIVAGLINGKVSGGRNIEELYEEASKKYKMNDREELEILTILADFGYPVFKDRLNLGGDEDPSRKEGFGEWQSQYHA